MDRERTYREQGHTWTGIGTETDRDWDIVGQRQGHRRTGRGRGTQTDRDRSRDTDGQGQEHRRTIHTSAVSEMFKN